MKLVSTEELADAFHAFLSIVGRGKNRDESFETTRDAPSADAEKNVGEGGYNRVERAADDDADREVEGVSAIDEGFEFSPKVLPLFLKGLFLFGFN